MPRFLFISLPLRGHLDWGGMLGTAEALTRRGHAVAWASGPAVQPTITQAGVDFIALSATGWLDQPALPAGLAPPELAVLRRQRALDAWLNVDTVGDGVQGVLEALTAWQPDLLIAEPYAAAAAIAAEIAEAPLAVCGRPGLPDRPGVMPGPASERIAELCKRHNVTGKCWNLATGQIRSPLLHVDFFSRRWYSDLPGVAPQTHFLGGQVAPLIKPAPQGAPQVLITLGSLFNQDPGFFGIAAEAVFLEGGQPLVVTGQPSGFWNGALLSALPEGTEVRQWVDFASTLPNVAGIIHHGGVGTTHAALCHGLPQVVVPHAGDQQAQAGRITQAQVGYGVRPADFSPANAAWLARQLLWNSALCANAQGWQAEFRALGGIPAAAHALERLTQTGGFVV
jgi:UDP:flavonoid glycosyltransferase YjiC (YdhE family)